jgi:hypothetical protein
VRASGFSGAGVGGTLAARLLSLYSPDVVLY